MVRNAGVDVAIEFCFVDRHRELDELLGGCVFLGVLYGRDRAFHRSSMLPADPLIGQTVTMTYWKPHALAKPHTDQLDLRMGDQVEATVELDSGVPVGTQGKVILANGFNWQRYRVAVRQWDRGRRSRSAQHRPDRESRQAVGQSSQARLSPVVGSLRHRFPGIRPDWSRFDGPAGTQMVDSAITAMSEWMASGNTAANGGPFAAAEECQRLMDRTRADRRSTPGSGSERDQLRSQHDVADLRCVTGDRRDPPTGRSDRRNPTRSRCQHHPVATGGRGRWCRSRAGALRPGDGSAATRSGDRPHRRTHEMGHRSGCIQPPRLNPGSGADHRGGARCRRQRLRRRRAPRPAPHDQHRRNGM